jgi:nitrite reductase/ring-hydroxylating ferredoxin subunit
MISLCHVDDIEEGNSKGFEVGKKYVFAVKKDGQLFLYYNYCPHLGTPLEWQEDQFLDNDGALIQCSTHGALFLIENGQCILGPCKGKRLKAIPFIIGNGFMMVEEQDISSLGRI